MKNKIHRSVSANVRIWKEEDGAPVQPRNVTNLRFRCTYSLGTKNRPHFLHFSRPIGSNRLTIESVTFQIILTRRKEIVNRDESTMIPSREWCLWLVSIEADSDEFVHGPPKPISSPREGHKRNRVYSPTGHEAHEGERPGPRNVQSPVDLAARKALAVAKCRRQYSWKSFTSLLLTESGTRWRQLRLQPNSMARSLASPPLGIELRSKTARRVCRYMLSALATESHEDAGKAYVYIVHTYGKIAESRRKMGHRWLLFTFIGPFLYTVRYNG